MPKLETKRMQTRIPHELELAAGLHYPARARTQLFQDIRVAGVPLRLFSIGRSRKCDFSLPDERTVSHCHAVIKRTEHGYVITDHSSTNGMYINGTYNRGPETLTVGMEIRLGDALLIAVDGYGRAPLRVFGISDLCHEAVRVYGNPSEAARRLGNKPSREFIRRKLIAKKRP